MDPDDEAAEHAAHRPLTGGAAMGAVSRVTVAVTGAVTTIVVARLLGSEGTGGFAVALTIVNVLTVLTTFGVEHGVAYYVSNRSWAPRHAFATSLRVAVVVGGVGALLGTLLRLAWSEPFGHLTLAEVALAAAALPFALTWFYGSFVALADDHYEGYVIPPALQSALALVLVVALAIPFDLTGAIVALFVSHVVAAAFTVAWGRRRLSRAAPGPPDEPGQLRRALRFGVKGYAANALQVLNYRVDVFVLAALAPASTVGYYSVALGGTAVLWLLPQALSDVLFPRVSALSASAHPDAEEHRAFVIAKSLRHTMLIVVLGAATLAVALWLLIVPVYGPDFRPAINCSLILIPGVCLIGVAGIMWSVIIGRGKPEYGLYGALATTPATMILYAVLIPPYEATGAAWATSLSFASTFLLAVFFFRRTTGQNPLPLLVPTRDELRDYVRLVPQIREWAAGRRQPADGTSA